MANFIEESISSEHGDDPENDSPEIENEEENFDYDDDTEWEGDDDESESPVMERPEAPDVDDFDNQATYDEAYEQYERQHEDFEAQMPGQIERGELDAEVFQNLDRIGLSPSSKVEARKLIAEANEQLKKLQNAEMRGDTGAARDARIRSEYFKRAAEKELSKDTPAQVQGKKNALKIAEGVIRGAKFSDAEQYKEKYPMGRGFDTDVRQAIDAFNDNATGDTVYCIREYSTLNENLADTPKGLSDGSQLLQIRVPSHTTARELVANAKASRMSVHDYLNQIGGLAIKPLKIEEQEIEDGDRFRGMSNSEYRKQRGFKIRSQVIGG